IAADLDDMAASIDTPHFSGISLLADVALLGIAEMLEFREPPVNAIKRARRPDRTPPDHPAAIGPHLDVARHPGLDQQLLEIVGQPPRCRRIRHRIVVVDVAVALDQPINQYPKKSR